MLESLEPFGEDVSDHNLGRSVIEPQKIVLKYFTYIMMTNINMFGSGVKDGVFGQFSSSVVVVEDS